MKWLKKHRKKGAFVILFAIMLTILWPLQTGIEIDSSTVPLVQKQLKESLVSATKSAAGQLDQVQLHQGNYVIDQAKATQAFGQIMEANLKVNPSSWEPEAGSAVKSPLHVKLYMYNQWSPGSLPGTSSTLLNTGPGSPSDSLYPPLQDVSIPSVSKPTILAVASETYTSFWGKKVVIEQFASAQVDYAFNGRSTSPNPIVQSVTFTGSPYDPTITIQGIGFGGFSTPYTGDPNVLTFSDTTRGWEGGNAVDGNSVTDNITSWSDNQIVVKPSGTYNTNASFVYEPGDAVSISLSNPQTKNKTSYNTTVSYPFVASITANSVNATYQNGYGNNANYQVNIPFSYAGYTAGNYNIAVVDSRGNTVANATQYLGTTGTSSISWSTTYPNAQATWHLVETDSMGRPVAQSNSVTGTPQAPPFAQITANTPTFAYQGGWGDTSLYSVTIPFSYGSPAGWQKVLVYDSNGNYVTQTYFYSNGSGSNSISWSTTHNNASATWHLVLDEYYSNQTEATSNSVTGNPPAAPQRSITASAPSISYQSGFDNAAVYSISIPFTYNTDAGWKNVIVYDANGNYVTSTNMYSNGNGSSSISWSSTYGNASQTWHLVMNNYYNGSWEATSNSVAGYPTAPPQRSITASTPSISYQSGSGYNAVYSITLPFSYYTDAGYKTVYVYDANGNYVTSTTIYANGNGSSSISWSATYGNASQTWHLVMHNYYSGSTEATSNSVTGNPPAPPTNFTVYSGGWLYTPTQDFYFTPTTSGNYTMTLSIYNPPAWTHVYIQDQVTGQVTQIGPNWGYGNIYPATFYPTVYLNGGHQYRLYDWGSGGYINLIQFNHQ